MRGKKDTTKVLSQIRTRHIVLHGRPQGQFTSLGEYLQSQGDIKLHNGNVGCIKLDPLKITLINLQVQLKLHPICPINRILNLYYTVERYSHCSRPPTTIILLAADSNLPKPQKLPEQSE